MEVTHEIENLVGTVKFLLKSTRFSNLYPPRSINMVVANSFINSSFFFNLVDVGFNYQYEL